METIKEQTAYNDFSAYAELQETLILAKSKTYENSVLATLYSCAF